jgi:hypothetical protein
MATHKAARVSPGSLANIFAAKATTAETPAMPPTKK